MRTDELGRGVDASVPLRQCARRSVVCRAADRREHYLEIEVLGDGHCFYYSLFLGMLLPLTNTPEAFAQTLSMLIGEEEATRHLDSAISFLKDSFYVKRGKACMRAEGFHLGDMARLMRHRIADFLSENRERFEVIYQAFAEKRTYDEWLVGVRTDRRVWADHVIIMAYKELIETAGLERPLVICQRSERQGYLSIDDGSIDFGARQSWIVLYHCFSGGERGSYNDHFNLFVPSSIVHASADLGSPRWLQCGPARVAPIPPAIAAPAPGGYREAKPGAGVQEFKPGVAHVIAREPDELEYFYQYVERNASEDGTRIAMRWPQGSLCSYGELNSRANALARDIYSRLERMPEPSRECGSGEFVSTKLVGIFIRELDRPVEAFDLIVQILAVHKAGAAFTLLHLDQGGVAVQCRATRPELYIVPGSNEHDVRNLTGFSAEDGYPGPFDDPDKVIVRPLIWGAQEHTENMPCRWGGDPSKQLAYIYYTSGSSGQKKPVMNSHEALANRFLSIGSEEVLNLSREDVVGQYCALHADASLLEIMMALGYHATLAFIPASMRSDPSRLASSIKRSKISVLTVTPSALRESFVDPGLYVDSQWRAIVTTGEAADIPNLRTWMQRPEGDSRCIINGYGPNECTIGAVMTRWQTLEDMPADGDPVPIGCANHTLFSGTKVWLLPHIPEKAIEEGGRVIVPGVADLLEEHEGIIPWECFERLASQMDTMGAERLESYGLGLELVIYGQGVGFGYCVPADDNPDYVDAQFSAVRSLNRSRFVKIKSPDGSVFRAYRTGDKCEPLGDRLTYVDLLRQVAAGEPDCLLSVTGRYDRQLKIRGKLFCPEEVEYRLAQSDRVLDVKVFTINSGDRAGCVLAAAVHFSDETLARIRRGDGDSEEERNAKLGRERSLYFELSSALSGAVAPHMIPVLWTYVRPEELGDGGDWKAKRALLSSEVLRLKLAGESSRKT